MSPSVLYGCSHSRSLRVCGVNSSSYSSDHLVCLLDESESLLRVFADSGGLYLLAQLFPYVHPGLWVMGAGPFEPTVSACLSRLPSYSPAGFLSPHSYVMLGLCMRLKEYSKLLGETGLRTYVWYLLRGVLGATEEGKENFLNLFLIFGIFFLPLSSFLFLPPSPSLSPSSLFSFSLPFSFSLLSLPLLVVEKQLSPAFIELLSFLPFLYLFHVIRSVSARDDNGRQLRADMYRIGIIHHLLSLPLDR